MDKTLADRLSGEIKIDVEQILREWWEIAILRDIFSSAIGDNLIFKGGTALRLAYGSPRFSDDLDFSIIKKFGFSSFKGIISAIEKAYPELKIADVADKFYTYIAQYKIREPWRPLAFSIKIEISKREIDPKETLYELRTLKSPVSNIEALGNVIKIETVYKEKMGALESRDEPRDLFDIWYLNGVLKRPFSPPQNKKIDKKIIVRDLRRNLPRNYWKVIDTLTGQ